VALAVVTVAAGGLPVVEVTAFGLPVTEAAGARGIAVTKVIGKPGLPVTFVSETGGAVTPPLTTFATFDGTPSASVVVSGGGLTVTHGSTANGTGVASTLTRTTGKFYFEIRSVTSVSNANGVGMRVFTGGVFSDAGGTFANGLGVALGPATSLIYANAVSTAKNLGAQAVGDVYGFAIDLTARLGWVRKGAGNWNADVAANPVTGANGVAIVAGAMSPMVRFTNGAATDAFTANFGQSAFAFTAPSGFSLGWGT
jgi:hypothetical protein